MLPVKYELSCRLLDLKTKKELGKFNARIVREDRKNAAFENGNIASGGQTFTIATPKNLGYKPFAHQVEVDGSFVYMIVSYQPLTHTQVGKTYSRARRIKEVILELE